MMLRAVTIIAVLTVAACSRETQLPARAFEEPAVQQLYTMPTAQYYATMQLASRIAQSCPRYRYDAALDIQINERRNEVGRGSLSAEVLREAIALESDVTNRSFEAKYGIDPQAEADLCDAADAETAEDTALSAVLVPA